jgi:hypothetical protein
MGETSLTQRWREELFRVLEAPESGAPLREAALAGKLRDWTKHMTHAAVATCKRMGWQAAAKGFHGQVLPVPRNEYLALDVIAFRDSSARWPMPVAVFELENSKDDDRFGYSLWKVLCVRAALRIVLAYRQGAEEARTLVTRLAETLGGGLPLAEAWRSPARPPSSSATGAARRPFPTATSGPGHSTRARDASRARRSLRMDRWHA